jgi:hypothetical protein
MSPKKLEGRLARFCAALADRRWHDTRSIIREAKVCAVNSCASDARLMGAQIDCERRMVRGNAVYFYRMRKRPA